MPIFLGKYDDWISFRNIFRSMIDQNIILPAVQKMQYLLTSLKGEAYDVVSSLEATAENYEVAWLLLNERYDDPGVIIGKHINHGSLRRLLDCIQKHLRALKALKRLTEHWDDLMIHMITNRLDQATYREWELTIQKGSILALEQLINFLSQRCRALEASQRVSKSTATSAAQEKSGQGKNTTVHMAMSRGNCIYCHHADHFIYKCDKYLALSIE